MKGIVVETDKRDAVVLSEDGLFTRIKNDRYQIGQTIIINENKQIASKRFASKRIASKWVAGAASMAAALAFCTIGAFAYYTPTDYVSMDVNPSVEYSVNRFDRILEAKAVNEDGKAILSELDLKNKKLQDAMKETLDQLIKDGYLKDDPDSGVVIATSNDDMDEAKQLASDLEQEIQEYLDTDGITAEVDAEAVGLERVKEAKSLGVTPGKLNLVEKLKASTSSAITDEEEWQNEWLNKPVKEINKAIKENRKLEKEKDKAKETFNGADSDDQDMTSEGGIGLDKNHSQKPDKLHHNGAGFVKENQKSQDEDQDFDEDSDQNSDQIENETGGAINEDQLTNDDQQNKGGQNNGENRPDNGKSPKGDDN